MLTPATLEILLAFQEETFKNGNFKLKEKDRELITLFINFNPANDTLDTRVYTALNKLLAQGVIRGSELTGLSLATRVNVAAIERSDADIHLPLYSDLSTFGVNAGHRLKPGPYTKYLFVAATPAELEQVQKLRDRLEEIQPIVAKYASMKVCVTRNGKLPKTIQKKHELEKIQSGLSPKLKEALMKVKERWLKVMTDNYNRYFTASVFNDSDFIIQLSATPEESRKIDDINKINRLLFKKHAVAIANTKGQYRPANAEEILKLAEDEAQIHADSFFDKLLFKLNGVLSSKHPFLQATERWYESTPFESTFVLDFDGGLTFSIHSQIITNFSVYGKPFHQFPTFFRDVKFNGTVHAVMSEYQLKVLLVKTETD